MSAENVLDGNFRNILHEYENVIDELQHELEYVKSEHHVVKSKICDLTNENRALNKQCNDILSEKINFVHKENDIVESLRQQINVLTNEKDYSTQLWQNAMKTIDSLEEDLKYYQSGLEGFVPKNEISKIKHSYEEQVKNLSNELLFTREKLNNLSKSTSNQIISEFSKIDKSHQVQENSFKIIKNLEEEILNLQQRLQECLNVNKNQEKKLKEQDRQIILATKKNEEYIVKIMESIQIVEAALVEKDGALYREKEYKSKILELNDLLNDYMKESQEKLLKETAEIRQEYNKKILEMEQELKDSQNDLKIKAFEIEKLSGKCSILECEIERVLKGNTHIDESGTSKLLVLEKNLETTFQKLLISEKQNISLVSQRDAIKNDMEEMTSHFERDIKTREIEKLGMQQKIKQLQNELGEVNENYCKECKKNELLNNKIVHMEKGFNENIETKEKCLLNSHSVKISELHKTYNEKLDNLKLQMDLQRDVNEKWKTEYKNFTRSFEDVITKQKEEIKKLKKENKKLISKLKASNKEVTEYKSFLNVLSKDASNLTQNAVK
ncbi:unnamed protein product [Brassicogethes aeneus]|uniref:Uncharacterized protein n=1 Tax=Brassicogethes aeneus TaxID=1431903 RepID=A0A9P0B8D2_BRAAE|nr:unnamed protein product [Brassicogethes aeneus]